MNKSTIRVMNDYVDFQKNRPDGIYLWIDKENIFHQYALIIGPENTPYFGGYFFFEIKYPEDYPKHSPSVTMITLDKNVRFNPNLYENGKVCLSILGTWSGPEWKPIMNIRLVLCSIQSLFGEYPVQNEPGFEKTQPDNILNIEYNIFLLYNTYKIAIFDVLESKYETVSKYFIDEIKNEFTKNKKKLEEDLLSYHQIYDKYFVDKQIYFMKAQLLDFNILVKRWNKIIET